MPGTVNFHRVLKAPAERIYRAFITPEAMAKWLPPHGFTCTVHHMEPRVGGTFKMSFENFSSGNGHSFGGEYLELVPYERIRHTDQFDDPNLPGQMITTLTFKPVSVGTELTAVQSGIPAVIPVEACYLGWQETLQLLAQHEVGALMVMQDGKLVGVVSERDYTRKVALQGKSSKETTVASIMTSQVQTVSSSTGTRACMALMREKKFRHLPIVDGDKVLGMISIRDIMDDIIDDNERTISDLESYIKS